MPMMYSMGKEWSRGRDTVGLNETDHPFENQDLEDRRSRLDGDCLRGQWSLLNLEVDVEYARV